MTTTAAAVAVRGRDRDRNLRLSLPSPSPLPAARLYPSSPFPSTPSKRRHHPSAAAAASASRVLLFLSLRSLFSLSSSIHSLSILPLSFLTSFVSLLFLSLIPPTNPIHLFHSLSDHQFRPIAAKSLLLAATLLLRFYALRHCGPAAAILAEFSGSLAARSFSISAFRRTSSARGFAFLVASLLALSFGWGIGFLQLLLAFISGTLAFFERSAGNWSSLRPLGHRCVRLLSLIFATAILLVPALVVFFTTEHGNADYSLVNLGLPLLNTVIFGVILNEKYKDEKALNVGKDLRREFLATFLFIVVLELFYFPKLSLSGLLLCGLFMWLAVKELVSSSFGYVELGSTDASESVYLMIMKPIRHILSERKSRKIALFLLINTGYMVVEFVAGFMSNSLGLISDACHMLFDCAALAIGLYASYISRLPANGQFNYGRGRFEVLSGYVNAVFLVLVGALIVLESFERILDPQEISTNSLLSVSIGGLAVNLVGLVFFHEEHHHAHGGSGSCSHSHSHSHNDHQHELHHHHHHQHHKVEHGHNHSDGNHHSHLHEHQHHHTDAYKHEDSCGNFQEHQKNSGHDSHHHCVKDHVHDENDTHRCKESFPHGNSHPHSLNIKEQPFDAKLSKTSHKRHHIDHNMQGIFLHVLADTLGSVGVVISTLLIKFKGWLVADPACSIFISIMIISSVLPLLRNSSEILLQRVPRAQEQDIKVAVDNILKIKGVVALHNLHLWNFTNTDIVCTIHLQVSADCDKTVAKKRAVDILQDVGIKDITIQMECLKT